MNRPVGIVVLVVLTGILGLLVLPGATASGAVGQSMSDANTVDSSDFDTTTFEITVHENGSATWTFRYEQRLDDDAESDARATFETFAETFEAEETDMYEQFTDQTRAMVEGNDQTDREMEATAFNRSATVDGQLNPTGVVEMSFRWDGFAETTDEQVVVGDVFEGMYITEDQAIRIQPDDTLEFQHAEPDPEHVGTSLEDATAVQWNGEQEFLDGQPRVIFEHPTQGLGTESTLSEQPSPTSVLPLGFVVLVFAAGIAIWYRHRTSQSTDSSSTTEPSLDADSEPKPAEDSAEPSASIAEDELLTDEDRVINLISKNGGRMKQVNIVEETGWSKSKVSMLLSDMEADGTISKLRVGRENIISLEGFEPEATKSPFDE